MSTGTWPEWLTPEYGAIHTAIQNEIKKALQHCYDSADGSGLNWTTEGWISCSASNVVGMLQRLGCPPPPVGEVEALPMPGPEWGDDEPVDEPVVLYEGPTDGIAGASTPAHLQPQSHSQVTLDVPPGTEVEVYGVRPDGGAA